MTLNKIYVDKVIDNALLEDIHYMDAATDSLIPENQAGSAVFIAKAEGILCGIDIALRVFRRLDDQIVSEIYKYDGDAVQKGEIIAKISGSAKCILKGERTALNLLQHLSGIATETNSFVKLVEGTKASISDTRKTLPGLRALQKYAVKTGSGKNHRFNLSDAAMIKDNHIDASGGIKKAITIVKEKLGHMIKIEVEVRTIDELAEALSAGADVILLDNMSLEAMKEAVKLTAGRAVLEASGNITKATVKETAETGVDIISVGALTHTVKSLDISLKWNG